MRYKRSDQVRVKKIGRHRALYVRKQKGIPVLNDTAFFIWEALETPFTDGELLYMLGEVFDGDLAVMKKDLDEILDLFLTYELIQTEP